jgi:hypothetical protein
MTLRIIFFNQRFFCLVWFFGSSSGVWTLGLYMEGRHSTTWVTSPDLFCSSFFLDTNTWERKLWERDDTGFQGCSRIPSVAIEHKHTCYFCQIICKLVSLLEIIQGAQERVGNTLELVGIDKNFLNGTPAAQQLRDSIDKWDYIKLKSFCSTKEMVSKLKRTPTEWEKIFASYTSDKELITRIYRELKN